MKPMRVMNPHHHTPTPPSGSPVVVRVGDDGFASDSQLASWVRSGAAVRAGAVLTTREGRRFMLQDALRIIGLQSGDVDHERRELPVDPYGLTGRVDTIRQLLRQGALLSADRVRLGQLTYDVEYGVLALPFASSDESGANPRVE
jgi:hypothetical protein